MYGSKGSRDEHRLPLAPTSQPQAELTTEGGQVATEGVAVDVAEVVAAAEQEGGRYADAPDEEPVSEGPGYDLVRLRLRLRVGVGVGVGVRARVRVRVRVRVRDRVRVRARARVRVWCQG